MTEQLTEQSDDVAVLLTEIERLHGELADMRAAMTRMRAVLDHMLTTLLKLREVRAAKGYIVCGMPGYCDDERLSIWTAVNQARNLLANTPTEKYE